MPPSLLHHAMIDAAMAAPDDVALRDGALQLSYAGLAERAAQIARTLSDAGVQRGDRVAVFAAKSADTVAALYAIMWCGAAYVPIDPASPTARALMILESAAIRVIVADAKRAELLSDLADGAPLLEQAILIGDEASVDLEPGRVHVADQLVVNAQPTTFIPKSNGVDLDLAYVLYTSGSTGVPKGVMLTHDHSIGFVSWAARHFALTNEDRFSSHAPLHFDLSVFDLYTAASVGGSVSLVPPKASIFPGALTKFIEKESITTWYSVPSVLSAMLLRGSLTEGRMPSLRNIVFAGEVFPSAYLRDFMRLMPQTRFTNLYGPTETNVCTYYDVPEPPDEGADIPIGRAIDNVELVVVDDGRVVEVGETGELWVKGRAVMAGYLGDADKTEASLVPDPRFDHLPDRLYRTGDLVREQPSGDLAFLGRNDSQVKSRGYRIELGEIETALNAHARVAECAVVAIPDPVFTNKIKVFLVADEEEKELRRHCDSRLPGYMVPDVWDFVAELPRTSTGKIDRWALAQ